MPNKSIQIAHNAVNAMLVKPDEQAQLEVQQLLSYMVEGAEHMAEFKAAEWDGRSTFFDYRNNGFPAGFVRLVKKRLERVGYTVRLARKPLPKPLGPKYPVVHAFGDDPRYDYQAKSVDRLIKTGCMISQIATGGGKSLVANLCAARIKRPTLFLTTRGVLMHQMRDNFEAAIQHRINAGETDLKGTSVGVLGDGHWSPKGFINVATVQTLMARLKMPDGRKSREKQLAQERRRRQTIRLLELFQFVIAEEAHETSGNSFFDIMRHCKNAHYRLALTATPFMRPDAEANMRLMASCGPIGIKVSEQTLIERGILAQPVFKIIDTPYQPDKAAIERYEPKPKPGKRRLSTQLGRTSSWQRAYKLGIEYNRARNEAIVDEVDKAATHGLPSIVLVLHKNHGHILESMLTELDIRARFVHGEHSNDQRRRALDKLTNGTLDVVIGTTILDVGVDVPSVGMIALAGGGKAEIGMRQRIGRGLREKKSGPNTAFIVDFSDEFNMHLKRHALTRRHIIENTPGFADHVLRPGQDFDYTPFNPKSE